MNFVGIDFWESLMFQDLKTEVDTRFRALSSFFSATRGLEEAHGATVRGLMFVQVYAVYEFTVNAAVVAAIDTIKAHRHEFIDVSPSLLALFLDPELTSIRDVSEKNEWSSRVKLLERAFSRDKLDLANETQLPSDRAHFRYRRLCFIFGMFGIKRPPVRRRRHIPRIEEVVNNRNSISHGGDTAGQIGRRYTRDEIRTMCRQMRSVCDCFISILEQYSSDARRHRR